MKAHVRCLVQPEPGGGNQRLEGGDFQTGQKAFLHITDAIFHTPFFNLRFFGLFQRARDTSRRGLCREANASETGSGKQRAEAGWPFLIQSWYPMTKKLLCGLGLVVVTICAAEYLPSRKPTANRYLLLVGSNDLLRFDTHSGRTWRLTFVLASRRVPVMEPNENVARGDRILKIFCVPEMQRLQRLKVTGFPDLS
jgi:hypothetical protein